jgi:hypothetical protein
MKSRTNAASVLLGEGIEKIGNDLRECRRCKIHRELVLRFSDRLEQKLAGLGVLCDLLELPCSILSVFTRFMTGIKLEMVSHWIRQRRKQNW